MLLKIRSNLNAILFIVVGALIGVGLHFEMQTESFPGAFTVIAAIAFAFILRKGWLDGSKLPRKTMKDLKRF
jgi:hypothetical protein